MTAPTVAERIDAVTALFGTAFVGGLLFLIVCAVAYVLHREQQARNARAARRAASIDAHLYRLPR